MNGLYQLTNWYKDWVQINEPNTTRQMKPVA